jgi:NAD(P)-dependent dehydrogenase (short-subunit alcohol dehydrogenase family)
MLLQDKVCIITGGAGSVGLEAARLFLAEGAKVMLVDRDEAALETAAALDDVATFVADVSKASDVSGYVDATVAAFGKIDVIFSNAGNFGVVEPIGSYPEDVFDQVMAVHVKGAFLAARYGIPKMQDGGSFIITSSVVGMRGDPGAYGYITAKHAQVGLMRCLAKEAAPRKIRVNTIHPGPISNGFQADVEARLSDVMGTDATAFLDGLIPLARHVTPAEVAKSVLYLASDMSSYTTGSTLMVDGGMTA